MEEHEPVQDLELGQRGQMPAASGMWLFNRNVERCSIYRVPDTIRSVQPEAYTPQLLIIGPLHHSSKSSALTAPTDITNPKSMGYKNMERHKWFYFSQFKLRFPQEGENIIHTFKGIIRENQTRLKEYYSESTDWIEDIEFMDIILYDSVFILEFIFRCFEESAWYPTKNQVADEIARVAGAVGTAEAGGAAVAGGAVVAAGAARAAEAEADAIVARSSRAARSAEAARAAVAVASARAAETARDAQVAEAAQVAGFGVDGVVAVARADRAVKVATDAAVVEANAEIGVVAEAVRTAGVARAGAAREVAAVKAHIADRAVITAESNVALATDAVYEIFSANNYPAIVHDYRASIDAITNVGGFIITARAAAIDSGTAAGIAADNAIEAVQAVEVAGVLAAARDAEAAAINAGVASTRAVKATDDVNDVLVEVIRTARAVTAAGCLAKIQSLIPWRNPAPEVPARNRKEIRRDILAKISINPTRNRRKIGDPLMDDTSLNKRVKDDLILLENQLPYFILRDLFQSINIADLTFNKLVIEYFNFEFPEPDRNFLHFTDLLRHARVRTLIGPETVHKPIKLQCSAEKLDYGGVKFEVDNAAYSMNVSFKDGCLKIPCFSFINNAEYAIRNIMALEQCHSIYHAFVCDYIMFLGLLINIEKDVDLLVKKGIIKNIIGQNESVAEKVNKLNLGITQTTSRYYGIVGRLNDHQSNWWKQTWANLKRVYLPDIWTKTATGVAVLLLILTGIQAGCSIAQVLQGQANQSTTSHS